MRDLRTHAARVFLVISTFCWLSISTLGMEFSSYPSLMSATLNAIYAEGDIEDGDIERLERYLARSKVKLNTAVYLSSPGGDLFEGMALGLFFKKNHIKTVVDGGKDCASACALAFLGGSDKTGRPWRSSSTNSRLGFHAFSAVETERMSSDEVQGVVSQILRYGRVVEAPIELLIVGFATPSSDIFWVSQPDICALGIKLWSVEMNRFMCN